MGVGVKTSYKNSVLANGTHYARDSRATRASSATQNIGINMY